MTEPVQASTYTSFTFTMNVCETLRDREYEGSMVLTEHNMQGFQWRLLMSKSFSEQENTPTNWKEVRREVHLELLTDDDFVSLTIDDYVLAFHLLVPPLALLWGWAEQDMADRGDGTQFQVTKTLENGHDSSERSSTSRFFEPVI